MRYSQIFVQAILAIKDIFKLRILLICFTPLVFSAVFWILISWFFWPDVLSFVSVNLSPQWLEKSFGWLAGLLGLGTGALFDSMTFLFCLLVSIPLVMISTSVISGLITIPFLVRFFRKNEFLNIPSSQSLTVLQALKTTLRSGAVFALLWALILPFWLLPPIGPIASFILSSWYLGRSLSSEVLGEVLPLGEVSTVSIKNRNFFFVSGILATLVWGIPIVNFLAPVWTYLFMVRVSLAVLNQKNGVS